MKPKKMSLANIQVRLSRAEMKKIMAGSGGCGSCTYKTTDGNSHTVTCSKTENGTSCVCPDGLGCGQA